MTKPLTLIRSFYLSIALSLTAVLGLPIAVVAYADCAPSTDPGVHQPVGSDASAFTFNTDTCMWESAHYIYNPATGITSANPTTYTYNDTTGKYDTTLWVYDAPSGAYIAYPKAVVTPPAGAEVIGGPAPVVDTGNSITNTGSGSNNSINNNGGATNGSSINGTGPNSNNTIDGSINSNTTVNNNTTAAMNNVIVANAASGNALTLANTIAGGAASGNAQDIANVVNLLQSSSNALGSNAVTFVANINGDVNGDLLLDPAMLSTIQPASKTGPAVGNNNITVNNQLGANINNTIDLTAQSGNAQVSANTTGGDATSGSATTIANVVNMINSAVTAGKSFLGVVNINGNLNGDILIPPNFVDQLLAANVPTVTIATGTIGNSGPSSTNTITGTNSNNTDITNTNNQGITNHVNATAQSGAANVSENTNAGNATTGSASTNITAFNLTGSNVVGSNDLLVFVNVLGKWVGLIVNAPAGATAAELGGGITSNTGPGSNNSIASSGNNNTTTNNDTNQQINNNIRTAANSGSATVSRNTNGGDATSGNAKGAVNLMNIENSTMSLSNYFGILFINVFGTWNGSFGMNTSAGDPIATSGASGAIGGTRGVGSVASSAGQTFTFIPNSGPTRFKATPNASGSVTSTSATTPVQAVNAVLAASTVKASSQAPSPQLQGSKSDFARKATIVALGVIFLITADAVATRRRSHQA